MTQPEQLAEDRLTEVRLTRDVIALRESGVEGITDAFRTHCAPDVTWINTGVPSVEGLDNRVELPRAQQAAWGFATTRVDIRSLLAGPGLALGERTDRVFAADGTEIFAAPVVGVLEWRDGTITQWRDYGDPGPLLAVGRLD